MNIEDFISEFSFIFEDTNIDDLKPSTSYLDLDEWDSMVALATMAHFDEKFKITIEPEVLFNCQSFSDLLSKIT